MQDKVEKILDEIRPYIKMHGGDVELLEITNGVVKLKVSGTCVGCRLADQTYKIMLGGAIKEQIPEIKDVVIC